jgi:hypothetical protein
MKYNNKSIAVPIEFDKQDEGHASHNPLTWKVITTYYVGRGVYSYKMYNGKKVLTGAFEGTQTDNDELVIKHFKEKKENKYGIIIRNL